MHGETVKKNYELYCIILPYCCFAIQFLGMIRIITRSLRVNFNSRDLRLGQRC